MPTQVWTYRDWSVDELSSAAMLTDIETRVAALEAWRAAIEAETEPTDPDPTDPAIPTWDDYNGVWPNGGLLVEGGTVWRNVSGVPLTTAPSGFPGSPEQWTHLFVEVTTSEPPVEQPAYPAWSGDSVAYAVDDRVTFTGRVYRCQQAHTSQPGWTPAAVPALWVDEGPVTP